MIRRRWPVLLAVALLASSARGGVAPCTTPGSGWCLARRFPGTIADGELGFRFGEPLDVDGDGRADVAAGARFELQQTTLQNGNAAVWSGATGTQLRLWRGTWPDGLFGHWVLPMPDLGSDGLPDVVVSAPTARVDGNVRGVVVARSPATGDELWRRDGPGEGNFGWDLSPAGDQDDDGHDDVFVGQPSADAGHVHLVSGDDGRIVRTYAPADDVRSFGWYVARIPDLDGDRRDDLAVGAPLATDAAGVRTGGAWVLSSATGKTIHRWSGADLVSGFGEIVAAAGDVDRDGKGDVAVASPRTNDHARARPGEVRVFSGADGRELRAWSGTQAGELFGRMTVAAGDLDGDGVEELAIGAPWYRRGDAARTGRVEIRSGRTGDVLSALDGDGADAWFGWHMRRAPDPDGTGRPALLIASLRHPVDGKPGVGVIDLYVWRGAAE